MKEGKSRYFYAFFGILLISFVLYHTFSSVFDPYKSEMAYEVTVDQKISVEAFVIRKEELVPSTSSKNAVYSVSNGSKVAKDSLIVTYYENSKDASVSNEIKKTQRIIKTLKDLQEQNEIYVADLDAVQSKIKNNLYWVLNCVNSNSFNKSYKLGEELLFSLAQNQLATKRESNFNDVIKDYEKKLNKLQNGFNPATKQVFSSHSGYYVNYDDGYEKTFDYDNVRDLTVSDLENPKKINTQDQFEGKLITENEWFLACVVDYKSAERLTKGERIKIRIPLSQTPDLFVTVEAINKDSQSNKAALILSCSQMSESLSILRKQSIDIITKSYTGLKVNSKAIRVIDNKKGVFVKLGSLVKFKTIDTMYSTEEYVIAKTENNTNQLKIYDEVIIKGKKLSENYG